ncbi:MAG: hypothetical protein KF816_09085 [Melioribacteraceae bacterium]|nr:hypothetical protein [Melioribacteraceae bacterium]
MKLSNAAAIFSTLMFLNILTLYAQYPSSIQINGGIIAPGSSSEGPTAVLQYSHPINDDFYWYISVGYSSWDKYKVTFQEDYSIVQSKKFFETYAADGHKLIPVNFGGKIVLRELKELVSFFTAEIGYSHLSYNNYKNQKIINPETDRILDYSIDPDSREKINENLFGIGLGIELLHPMSKNINLHFLFKVNSYFNSDYYKFYNSRAIYYNYLVGVSYYL